jgi:hypothetical protein
MQSKIGRSVLSSIGVATLAVLSTFGSKVVDNSGSMTGPAAKGQGDHHKNMRLACPDGQTNCPATVGGVRG